MFIKQISVFIENRQGRMAEFASLLAENGIDLIALSIADTTNFGILRVIVDDYRKTSDVLRENGYTANITDVLAVAVSDQPGGLAFALNLMQENDIFIEYLYSLVRRVDEKAIIIFRVNHPERAVSLFSEHGVRLLSQEEINKERA